MTGDAAPRVDSLRYAPAITVAAFLLPIGAGLAGTLLPAFGYLPALGHRHASLQPWRELMSQPGFATSLRLTLFTGIAATLLSFALAVGFCATIPGRPWARRIGGALAPILGTPHSAMALGFAFLALPSGLLARAASPWLTGWTAPPDIATVGDPWGIALIACLLVKEVPYLVLMIGSALHQIPAARHLAIASSLGYGPVAGWLKVVLPQIYPQIRLPVYAVLAFSLSVVDVALIVGPGNPPTLAVLALRWFQDADLRFYFPAAATAMLLLVLVVVAIAAWHGVERALAHGGPRWFEQGRRTGVLVPACHGAAIVTGALFATGVAAIASVCLWSFAAQWRFPAAWPTAWTLDTWTLRSEGLAGLAATTLAIGFTATLVALLLCLACLEHESRRGRGVAEGALWMLYLPLLVPQMAFLFGTQVLLVRSGYDGTFAAVVWSHLIFVLPYLFLSLADPWRALDPRYARSAASLGASRLATFLRVKVPLLLRALLTACAVAFAVSVGQYLPTVFAGNGRIATLTTEAVTLAGGADRRVIGTVATLQALLPMLAYLVAALVPTWFSARRRGKVHRP